jgi:hypothetical protein
MGKTLVSVRSKMYHLGLSVVDAAAVFPTIAASVASTRQPATMLYVFLYPPEVKVI